MKNAGKPCDTVLLNINIEPKLREKFKIKTIKDNTTMTDVVIDAIKEYVNNK